MLPGHFLAAGVSKALSVDAQRGVSDQGLNTRARKLRQRGGKRAIEPSFAQNTCKCGIFPNHRIHMGDGPAFIKQRLATTSGLGRNAGDHECCGILRGDGGIMSPVELTQNVAVDPSRNFEIDPAALDLSQ